MSIEGCVRKRIAVLGSTGSIGLQTLDVVRRHSDELEIVALAANTNVAKVIGQAHEFKVSNIAFGDERLRENPMRAQAHGGVSVGFGQQGLLDLVRLDEVDVVGNALVGAAGMRASYETLACGKQLALANKESLVVAGDLIMPLAAKVDALRVERGIAPQAGPAGALMPIDSDHGAIYQ